MVNKRPGLQGCASDQTEITEGLGESGKRKNIKCKTAPHIPPPPFFKTCSLRSLHHLHPSLSSAAFRGARISRSLLDNKLTAVENGFFQFGRLQSHYIVIGEPHDCLPV